jgi:hypothetical protein
MTKMCGKRCSKDIKAIPIIRIEIVTDIKFLLASFLTLCKP